MKVLSLFDGISCGRVALERLGINVERYVAYEIEDKAIKISQKNYPDIEQKGDVFKGNFTDYQGFDLLIGGSPCTYWSVAQKPGKRETTNSGFGWELFQQYIHALNEAKPKYYLYENNFSMGRKIYEEISKAFGHEPILINSADYSAQNRKRYYWTNIPNIVLEKVKAPTLQDIVEYGYADREKSLCLTRRYAGFSGREGLLCRRYFGKSFGSPIFKDKETRDLLYLKWKNNPYFDKDEVVEHDNKKRGIRQMTVKECERLQTLPDDYTKCEGVNDVARIEAIGNGWTVNVICQLLKPLKTI